MALSDKQFAGLSSEMEAKGGFTIRAFGSQTGKRGADIYSVGGAVPAHVAPGPLGGSAIKEYTTQHADVLRQPSMNLGGWQETDTERALDVSKEFPRTSTGLRQAKGQALRSDQISIGELDKSGDYVGDIDNPFHARTEPGSRLKAFQAAPEAHLRMLAGGNALPEQVRWLRG